MAQCKATTGSGARCRRKATHGDSCAIPAHQNQVGGKPQCQATTGRGTRCKRDATANGYCEIPAHQRQGGVPEADTPKASDTTDRTVMRAKKYLEALAGGCTRTTASKLVGISRDTIAALRRDAKPFAGGEERFGELELRAEATAIGDVEDALKRAATSTDRHGKYNTGAIAFFLKNRAPERWKDMKVVEVVERLKDQERARFFHALDQAGVDPDQIEVALKILEAETDDAAGATVH